MIGRIAIQQAFVLAWGFSYREASRHMRVHPRTLWQHVAAANGSNCRRWEDRSEEERRAAEVAAFRIFYDGLSIGAAIREAAEVNVD